MSDPIDFPASSRGGGIGRVRDVDDAPARRHAPRRDDDGGGLVRERGWKIDLAGPFDPRARRGTYLDILV